MAQNAKTASERVKMVKWGPTLPDKGSKRLKRAQNRLKKVHDRIEMAEKGAKQPLKGSE